MFVSAFIALIAMPASAAEFYIVQDIAKLTCTISQELPKDDAHTMVGEGAYNDEASAASDMRKMLACNPIDASSGAPQAPTGLKKE
jgi:hypothetical protein